MSAVVAAQRVSQPTFGTPQHAGAGVAFTPSALVAKPAVDASKVKEEIIVKCSTAVIGLLEKIFGDELETVGNAISQGQTLEGSKAWTITKSKSSITYGLRPELLKKQHIIPIALSDAQKPCFHAILKRCLETICDDPNHIGVAFYLTNCESLPKEKITESQILRSKVFKVVNAKITADMLKLF
jgi:hypothetical protein